MISKETHQALKLDEEKEKQIAIVTDAMKEDLAEAGLKQWEIFQTVKNSKIDEVDDGKSEDSTEYRKR